MTYEEQIQNRTRIRFSNQMKIFRRIIFLIMALMAGFIVVIYFGSMNDEVSGSGSVAGLREYEIKSLVSGKIAAIDKYEGDTVTTGERLAVFETRHHKDRIQRLENQVKELNLALEAKQKEYTLLLKDPLPSDYRHTELRLKEAEEIFERSKKELEIYRGLYDRHAISQREYLKVETSHFTHKMTLERLREDWKKIQNGDMAKEILEKGKAELDRLEQQYHSRGDELAAERKNLEDYVLRVPESGIITEIPPRPGNYFEPGNVVVRIAATSRKKIVAMIPEKQIFKIAPGQLVRITSNQYNYLDYGYFYGKVDLIYQLPETIGGMKYYPVKIIITREPYPLRYGSSCDVSIITGRERILFALLGLQSRDYFERRKQAAVNNLFEKAYSRAEQEMSSEQKKK